MAKNPSRSVKRSPSRKRRSKTSSAKERKRSAKKKRRVTRKKVTRRTTRKRAKTATKTARRRGVTKSRARTGRARVGVSLLRAARAAGAETTVVEMTIDFGAGAPADVMSVRRIDGQALSSSRKTVTRGGHTTSWNVLSPTVRPIGYSVTITEVATGAKVFERKRLMTGLDGKGGGAGRFTV